MDAKERVHYQACNLCEAICGLEIKTRADKIVSVKGNKNDPLSRGHICPKAIVLQDIHNGCGCQLGERLQAGKRFPGTTRSMK